MSHTASSPGWWHAALVCCLGEFLGGNEGHVQENEAKFLTKASVSAAPSCSELLMCSLRGAWVSENYCFSRCTAVCILPALITWCGWYWLGRDAGTELGKKLQFLLLRGEIFTFGTCLEASLDVRAGCW